MTKQHIDKLKELVVASADLTEPIDYFIQHVSTDAEIVRASQPAASPLLLQVTLGLVKRHCGQGPYVLASLFLHAPAYQLWHGGCHLGGYVGASHLLRRYQNWNPIHHTAAGYPEREIRALFASPTVRAHRSELSAACGRSRIRRAVCHPGPCATVAPAWEQTTSGIEGGTHGARQ
jgi:hypothetical protein